MQNANPEQGQRGMEMWMAWFNKNGAALVDGGNPLGEGMVYRPGASSKAQPPMLAAIR